MSGISKILANPLWAVKGGARMLKGDVISRIESHRTVKPRTLNLLINDICNAGCTMCNIWQRLPEDVISPEELAEILNDPLFCRLRYIGVSGGEPTLRRDLPDIYRAIAKTKPDVNTGIITNALVGDVVIDRIERSAEICNANGLSFNVMVSLDGVGDVHDRVRGTDGAFDSAVEVVRHFRDDTDIPVSVGCTVTKENVWGVYELHEFCEAENVPAKFRVAEFIDRLYNDNREASIRNFTDRELYHLGLFFAQLEQETPIYAARFRTYRNIRKMLLEGADRSIGCYMHTQGATIDSTGELMYCAPKSPKLGNCLEESAADIYQENIDVRESIIDNHCDDCIHDYPSPRISTELEYLPRLAYWRMRMSLDASLFEYRAKSKLRWFTEGPIRENQSLEEIMILGWYGTETAGDKAILGAILKEYRVTCPNARLVLGSLNPDLSKWTLQELGYPHVEVISTYSREFLDKAGSADEVVMGGGPLMHLDALGFVLAAFMQARANGNRTRIAGCGIGPLDKGQKYRAAVAAIIDLADVVELRSGADVEEAERITGRSDVTNSGDPAFSFVDQCDKKAQRPERQRHLNLYLREWPIEYRGGLSRAEFKKMKAEFETELGVWIHTLCERRDLRPRLLAMHHFHVGGDDRRFNRWFATNHLQALDPIVEQHPMTVQEILGSMREGRAMICMRYHSVGFASELGEDFYAIDYSRGGKIERYLTEVGKLDRMFQISQIANGDWHTKFPLSEE